MVENQLLSLLPPHLSQKLQPHLKQIYLEQETTLLLPGEPIQNVYFPTGCLISITITMIDGSTAEVGLVGNEGMLGANALMGNLETTQTDYTVQIAGSALRIDAGILCQEFEANSELRKLLLRYIQSFIAQVSQTAACNRLHLLEQRFARWLLECQARVESDRLSLTHQFVATMLGVRRAGITQAAQKLQAQGIIQYRQGQVQILDQAGLESVACDCFGVMKKKRNRLMVSQ